MNELDSKLNETFPGLVVRKDLVKLVKGNAVVPAYVLEYLLGQYCATNDEETVKAGIEAVKEVLRQHYVNRNEAELVKSRIKEKGHWKVIDRLGVELNERKGIYEAAFSNLGIRKVPVDSDSVKRNQKLLVGGVWCLVDVEYEAVEDKDASPWNVRTLKPIQLAGFDPEQFLAARRRHSDEEWLDILVQSLGFDPEAFGRRNKLFQILRLVPFCERNYNLIELGPKGTGKSHVYSECSPHGMLLSGGEVTVAKLFVNNSSGKIGLVGYWDCVAFDEFAGKQKKPDKALVDIMKNYMANKTFSRGIETLGAEASMAFVGNTLHTVPQMLKNSHLFEQLPDLYIDPAFLDRLHAFLPGWEVDIIRSEMFTDGYGFIVDYLSEAMHWLRDFDFSDRYRKHFELSDSLSTRDKDGVNKTFSGLVKLLYPDGDAPKEKLRELLEFAIECRRRVKDQILRIDKTFDPVDFSYVDRASGEKKTVRPLEMVQYPALYGGVEAEAAAFPPAGAPANDAPPSAAPAAEAAPAAPRKGDTKYVEIAENQTGVDFDKLFGPWLKGAKKIEIVDPFIRHFHQCRNLMELMETILKNKAPEDEVEVRLETTSDPDQEKALKQDDWLRKIQESCDGVGIVFRYDYATTDIHDRSINTDNGWRILLGRGLDIYQPCERNDAFVFATRTPSQRYCKAFSVTYLRTE